jgi:large subunit ribosomal protein L9
MFVRLHPEVSATIEINVARSTEEAALQASGKSIQELAAEAEAEAEFEIAELFDDIGAAANDDDMDDAPRAEATESDEASDEA